MSELEQVVVETRDFINTVGRPLKGPTVLESLHGIRRLRLKAGLPLNTALSLFKSVFDIAYHYNPEKESFEAALDRVRARKGTTHV